MDDLVYLEEALKQGDIVRTDLANDRDRIVIWGDNGKSEWTGVYRREEFITEKEAKEKYPEWFI